MGGWGAHMIVGLSVGVSGTVLDCMGPFGDSGTIWPSRKQLRTLKPISEHSLDWMAGLDGSI